MWIYLYDGFFSIVSPEPNSDELLVRSRYKGDIERVFEVDSTKSEFTDYPYRAYICRKKVAEIIQKEVLNICYKNFKNSVPDVYPDKQDDYMQVWTVMFYAQEKDLTIRQIIG